MSSESIRRSKRQWYLKNKDKALAINRAYYKRNRLTIRIRQKDYDARNRQKLLAYQRQYRKSGRRAELGRTLRGRYQNYKDASKRRGLAFEITKEQFEGLWRKPCFYCGDAIETVGLDRVDNDKGYTFDNVVSCCKWCNYAKHEGNQLDFIDRCKRVASKWAGATPTCNATMGIEPEE